MATKRKTYQDSNVTNSYIGKLLPDDHGLQRDSIHTAVLPVIAGARLRPNEKVQLKPGSKNVVISADYDGLSYLGRVDPYLEMDVRQGQEFLLWLRPNSVSGLRHHWAHPALDD